MWRKNREIATICHIYGVPKQAFPAYAPPRLKSPSRRNGKVTAHFALEHIHDC